MKLFRDIPLFLAPVAARIALFISFVSVPALAANVELAVDAATEGPGKFAVEEIRREAEAQGMRLGNAAGATRIALTVGKEGDAAPQSYRIRVRNEGDRLTITVLGADAAGAMYGGLDIAEAIRTGTLNSLKNSDHKPTSRGAASSSTSRSICARRATRTFRSWVCLRSMPPRSNRSSSGR